MFFIRSRCLVLVNSETRASNKDNWGEWALLILLVDCIILAIDFLLYEHVFHKLCSVFDTKLNFLSAIQRLVFVSLLGTSISTSGIVNITAIGFFLIAFTHWIRRMEFLSESLRRLKRATCLFVMIFAIFMLVGWYHCCPIKIPKIVVDITT